MRNQETLIGRRLLFATLITVVIVTSILPSKSRALTTILSANSNTWDVQDITDDFDCPDDGSINDGGQDAFDNFGSLQVRVLDETSSIIVDDESLCAFGLTNSGRRWSTTIPVEAGTSGCDICVESPSRDRSPKGEAKTRLHTRTRTPKLPTDGVSGIFVSRALFAPATADYMRYIDTFTNMSGANRTVLVAWGGDLGSDDETTITGSSSGDLNVTATDTWAATIENPSLNPAGPATDAPVSYAFRSATDTSFLGTGESFSIPFDTGWSGNGDDQLSFVFQLTLAPGESKSLAYFVYRGIEEGTDGPGGQPPPATGAEITKSKTAAANLVATPDFGDLSPAERAAIVNWPVVVMAFEFCLQDDSNSGTVLQFDSAGNYVFCCGGTTFSGTGTFSRKGGNITLSQLAPDRRVNAKVDLALGKGSASLQSPVGVTKCTITDRNINNNTCACNGGAQVRR